MKKYVVLLPYRTVYIVASFAYPSSTGVDFYLNTEKDGMKRQECVAGFYSSQIIGWGLVME